MRDVLVDEAKEACFRKWQSTNLAHIALFLLQAAQRLVQRPPKAVRWNAGLGG